MEPGFHDPREYSHFKEVIASFFNYHVDSALDISRTQANFDSLKPHYKAMLPVPYDERIAKLKAASLCNYYFLLHIVHPHKDLFPHKLMEDGRIVFEHMEIPLKNVSKVRTTLRQLVRDWTAQGQTERDTCYGKILGELGRLYPDPMKNGRKITVLCPGSGLGRLPYEIALRGFKSQGNEFSYFMLLTSDYILNKTSTRDQFTIQPFIHNFSNVLKLESVFAEVTLPDDCPNESIPEESELSMVAGEFIEVYKQQTEQWDCIVTCFFMDTANNIFEYIDTIYHCLVPGGVWINLGPLLYHYADMHDEMSIELSWDEFRHVVLSFGFSMEKESMQDNAYVSDSNPLLQMTYKCIFFTAKKPTN